LKLNLFYESAFYVGITKLQSKINHVIAASSPKNNIQKTGYLVATVNSSKSFLSKLSTRQQWGQKLQTKNGVDGKTFNLNIGNSSFKDTSTVVIQQKTKGLQTVGG
jgi:hypothetical protein